MEITLLDWILFGTAGFMVVVGLFRGLSGELGSLAGFAAALAAGYFLYGPARACAATFGLQGEGLNRSAGIAIDFVFALIAYGVVRAIVAKFVGVLLPQPTNALLGAVAGLLKSVVVVGLLIGVGFVQPGEYSTGLIPAHSTVIRLIAGWADWYAAGACR